MKKILFVVFCIVAFSKLNAQTYTSGHISLTIIDSAYHDSSFCASFCIPIYTITIDSSYVGDSVNIVDIFAASLIGSYVNTTGVSPWIFSDTLANAVTYDNDIYAGYIYFSFPEIKITSGSDTINDIINSDSLLVTNPCLYSAISGAVYIDNNGDCIFDSGDVGITAPLVLIGDYIPYEGPYSWGWEDGSLLGGAYFYNVLQSWMINCTIFLPSYYAFIFPPSSCFSTSYTFTSLPQTNVNFPLQCTNNVDIQCYTFSPERVRPHTPLLIEPFVSNTGCDSISGQLTLVLDNRVIYDSSLSSNPADTVHGDTLIWNYANLTNLSGGAYWNSFFSNIYLTLNSTVVVGDTLCFRIYTNIPPTDINPSNNDYTVCLPVVYSYDPNSKEVSPTGTGPQGYIQAGDDTLTYNIHFQNTGSDVANNISIIDTLDSHVNASSLRIVGATNNMTPQWLTPTVVQFNFNDIYLPDSSSNEAASQGEVRFSVALNKGLTPGTQIKNTGYIYFDANPPVITNTTLNTIAEPNKVNSVTTNTEISIYPNPASTILTITSTDNIKSIIMSNIVGQMVYANNYNTQEVYVDISALPAGIYFVKVNEFEVKKFVKE